MRILDYKVFYSDPDPLFDEDKEVHILTVQEESTSSHLRKLEIKIHFGETKTWSYEDDEVFECPEFKRREVSRMFLNEYRKWNLDKLFAFGDLRDRRETIGLSHTKAGKLSHLHGLPKEVRCLLLSSGSCKA